MSWRIYFARKTKRNDGDINFCISLFFVVPNVSRAIRKTYLIQNKKLEEEGNDNENRLLE